MADKIYIIWRVDFEYFGQAPQHRFYKTKKAAFDAINSIKTCFLFGRVFKITVDQLTFKEFAKSERAKFKKPKEYLELVNKLLTDFEKEPVGDWVMGAGYGNI